MPSRNVSKNQAPASYYHVYGRGSNKQNIFSEAADYQYFLKLFDRYLSEEPTASKLGVIYPHYDEQIEILAYCLMSNHFHLLIYQQDTPYLEKCMRSLMTSYSRYFNLKYERTGPLFESRYKAVRIGHDASLQHISRYIHLNPKRWHQYRYSSLQYYRDGGEPYWLKTKQILDLFGSRAEYLEFTRDYEQRHDMLSRLKHELADH